MVATGRDAPGGAAGDAGQGDDDGAGRERGGRTGADRKGTLWGATLKEWGRSAAWAVLAVLLVRSFACQNFVIDSGSMENTLLVGDMVAVNRAAFGSRIPFTDVRVPGYSEPRFGDVLVFDPHHEEDMVIVKRLVGLPGDTLEMRDRTLYRNGEAVDEPYAVTGDLPDLSAPSMAWQREVLLGGPRDDYRPSRDTWGPLVLPPDRYFMLGDNRDYSLDSRFWGLLEGWRFIGRAVAIYFSYNRDSHRSFSLIREVRGSRIGDRIQ